MVALTQALGAWGTAGFAETFKNEVRDLDTAVLPLQDALTQTSYAGSAAVDAVVLKVSDTAHVIRVKTGIFFTGVIAGSCCADDPTPVIEQPEYCVVQFDIDKATAQATLTLLND